MIKSVLMEKHRLWEVVALEDTSLQREADRSKRILVKMCSVLPDCRLCRRSRCEWSFLVGAESSSWCPLFILYSRFVCTFGILSSTLRCSLSLCWSMERCLPFFSFCLVCFFPAGSPTKRSPCCHLHCHFLVLAVQEKSEMICCNSKDDNLSAQSSLMSPCPPLPAEVKRWSDAFVEFLEAAFHWKWTCIQYILQ